VIILHWIQQLQITNDGLTRSGTL